MSTDITPFKIDIPQEELDYLDSLGADQRAETLAVIFEGKLFAVVLGRMIAQQREDAEMDDTIRDQLRALGYAH